jgi:tRNA uridine 5-carboxymethylaminomethyl modification enzyme
LGEGAAHALSRRLRDLGFPLGRMKTGTPPRFFADSIHWDLTDPQPSDDPPVTFSFHPQPLPGRVVACAITRTGSSSHDVIRSGIDRSPLFSGRITGTGPRYCPSIEDKVFRFPDKDSHQIFLEPEGLDSDLVYPNGISTSLPRDIQEAFVRTIPALADVRFAAHGYAVEYDHVDPTECQPTLETSRLPRLFLAGQINGTTGYEEAAGQGLVAGINAAHRVLGRGPFVLGRHEAYIGVLIDDLTTRGATEPYRMFTSLAEHRLLLRHHDADVRLWGRARDLGLLDPAQARDTESRAARRARAESLLRGRGHLAGTLEDALRRPDFTFDDARCLEPALDALELDARDVDELVLAARYAGYVAREREQIAQREEAEGHGLEPDLPYASIPHLRMEARQKFARIRPATLGQAARIPGIGPADIGTLLVWLRTQASGRGAAR